MSDCDACPNPGQCCQDFSLNVGGFPVENWRESAKEKMRQHGMPFIPLRVAVEGTSDLPRGGRAQGNGMVAIRFTCPLVRDGRCSDYENRPNLCRIYEPGEDGLCALYVKPVETDELKKGKSMIVTADVSELSAKLRKLAEDAWPKGPWRADRHLNWAYPQTDIRGHVHGDERVIVRFLKGKPDFSCTIGKAEYEWANAEFIAAASPEVVEFLLDHIEVLQSEVDRLRAEQ